MATRVRRSMGFLGKSIQRGKDQGPVRLRKGIKASRVEGLTLEDPENGHSRSSDDAIPCNCLPCVLGAGRGKSAAWRQKGRDHLLIESDRPTNAFGCQCRSLHVFYPPAEGLEIRPAFLIIPENMRSTPLSFIPEMSLVTATINSVPAGNSSWWRRKASFTKRFDRLRTTAVPRPRFRLTPRRAPPDRSLP
jgi:hypothetical protein